MAKTASLTRIRMGALSLAISGILFVLYPAIRPMSDEVSLEGAAAFASKAWTIAHVLAILAFILLTLGLLALYFDLQATSVERLVLWALVVSWIGVGLTLPFYGAEVFGLRSIGQEALRQQTDALMTTANDVRTGPGLPLFLLGLILLAVGAIIVAVALWKAPTFPTWSGVPFAAGFAFYIPQFVAPQPIRVAHGVLVAAGSIWIAGAMWRHKMK